MGERLIIDQHTTRKVNGLRTRPGSMVVFGDGVVHKTMSEQEVKAYGIMDGYRSELAERGIKFPMLLGRADRKQIAKAAVASNGWDRDFVTMQKLGTRITPLDQHFGNGLNYNFADFQRLCGAFQSIREVVPAEHFLDFHLHSSSLPFLEKNLVPHWKVDAVRGSEIIDLVDIAERQLQNAPLLTAHRDPNLGNVSVGKDKSGALVEMVDLDTMGLENPGYDEGRFSVHLALDTIAQKRFQAAFHCTTDKLSIGDEEKRLRELAFWNTVVVRGVRELRLIEAGHYEANLGQLKEQNDEFDPDNFMLSLRRGVARTTAEGLMVLESML